MAKRKIADPNPKAVENVDLSIYRIIPAWIQPLSIDGNTWREISRKQPVFMDCITNLTMYAQSLPWDIRAKKVDEQDKLEEEIDTYKDIFTNAQDGAGYLNYLSLLIQDFYTLPFGCATETIRYDDGKLFAIRQIDGATLYPYPDSLTPVIQYVPDLGNPNVMKTLFFSPEEMVRMYQMPRSEIRRRHWGMAQPEKIYFALELLNRGDRYYANLLLDTPEAGLLDLGDMSKDSAEKWLESMKNLFTGIDAFKVPVLYEHTIQAKYLPFGRAPADLSFQDVTLHYIQLVTAAFGLTPSDLGIKNTGGGGLSGQIREERVSKSTGKAFLKIHLLEHFNKLLPNDLQFIFVDTDDELLVSKGRARSANAVAGRNLIEAGALTPDEWRRQLKADGLITIPLVDKPKASEFDIIKEINGTADQVRLQEQQLKTAKNQGGFGLGKQRQVRGGKLEAVQGKEPVAPSNGGQGEIKSDIVEKSVSVTTDMKLRHILMNELSNIVDKATDVRLRRLVKLALKSFHPVLKSASENDDAGTWSMEYVKTIFDEPSLLSDNELITRSISDNIINLSNILKIDKWWGISLDDDIILNAFTHAYKSGLKDAAEEIQQGLYENGFTNKSTVSDSAFNIETDISDKLYDRIPLLIELIDDGTEFFLNRLTLSSISSTLDSPLLSRIKNIETVDELIDDDGFINYVVAELRGNLSDWMLTRAEQISEFELQNLYNKAKLEQYNKAGLTQKTLLHLGNDVPCETCQELESLGYVDLNYEYDTKMGKRSEPPIHLNCHHVLIYNKKELSKINPKIFD